MKPRGASGTAHHHPGNSSYCGGALYRNPSMRMISNGHMLASEYMKPVTVFAPFSVYIAVYIMGFQSKVI